MVNHHFPIKKIAIERVYSISRQIDLGASMYIYIYLVSLSITHIYIYIHHYIFIFQVKTQNILKWQSHPWSLDFWGHRSSCLQSCLWGPQMKSTVSGEEKVTWVGGVDKKPCLWWCDFDTWTLETWCIQLLVRAKRHAHQQVVQRNAKLRFSQASLLDKKSSLCNGPQGRDRQNIPKESVN